MKQVQVDSTAEAYIELLAARGVDYFFGNAGTDFGPIVDAYAKRLEQELPVPKPVTVPHEITAMAMAAGYAMVTRKPQVVMVHTLPGTANATGGLINARNANVPMLFSAGRTPLTESGLKGSRNGGIHWAQESRDQGSMVREWVKWDYELRPDVDLEGVVDRALAITQSEPQGPVYLSLPREVLAHEIESFEYSERPRMQPNLGMASPESIKEVAGLLAKAKNPIALTSALGRDAQAVPQLVKLAEMLNLAVYSGGAYMNFPVTHPLHQGGMPGPALAEADVVLVFEQDVPWMPSAGAGPNEEATVVGIGVDPLYTDFPLRSFPVHVNLTGLPRYAIEALIEALVKEKLDQKAIAARGEKHATNHKKVKGGGASPSPVRERGPSNQQSLGVVLLRAAAGREHDGDQRARARHVAVRIHQPGAVLWRIDGGRAGLGRRRGVGLQAGSAGADRSGDDRRRVVHVWRTGGGALGVAQDEHSRCSTWYGTTHAGTRCRARRAASTRTAGRRRRRRSRSATSHRRWTSRWSARRQVATASGWRTRRSCRRRSSAPCTRSRWRSARPSSTSSALRTSSDSPGYACAPP